MATDTFLKIPGIKGESGDSKHKDEIELESFSWGVSQTGTQSFGSGGGAGKASFQDLTFQKKVDASSPTLMIFCATGKHIKEPVLLTVRKAGGEQQEYYQVKLTDTLVSSFQAGGAGDSLNDQVSLNYGKIEFSYKKQKADGTLDAPIEGKYDIKATKAL